MNIDVELVEDLLKAVKSGDEMSAQMLLDELTRGNELGVVHQVEEISQNLHKTLEEFGEDAELLLHTKHDLPDVSERLEYVIETTEEASNKTLSAAENAIALLDSIVERNTNTAMSDDLSKIQSELMNIMMNQSFQDLTGQVLKRVMILVGSLEQSLIALIAQAGIDYDKIPKRSESSDDKKAAEMQGIGPNVTRSSKEDVATSQDDVDDLLGSLGI